MSVLPQLTAGMALTSTVLAQLLGQSAYKSSDQSLASNTTLQNDTALALTLTGSGVYRFEAWIYVTGTTAKLSFTFAGTAQWSNPGGTVVTASAGGPLTAAAGGWFIAGTITAAAAGDTLQLQWAQSSSSGTATVVKAGSILTVQRLS